MQKTIISSNGQGHVAEDELCSDPKYADFLHLPHGLEGYFDYEQGLACAKEQGKPVLSILPAMVVLIAEKWKPMFGPIRRC